MKISYWVKFKRWPCGKTLGHRLHPTDRGWMIGSNKVDRWCERCGKLIEIPLSEEDYRVS
jgi:hypothetical protein